MSLTPLLVWASLGVLAAAYAHGRLSRFTVPVNQRLLDVVLAATGIVVGLVMMERTGAVTTMLSSLHGSARCTFRRRAHTRSRAGKGWPHVLL